MDNPKKILLIDDDESFCNLVKKIAESFQVPLEVANTLDDGRKKFEAGGFSALFVDGYLPDGEGLSLVREIREKQPDLPIALISVGYSDTASFQKLKDEFKINYVLTKPVHEDDLKKLFELALKEKVEKTEASHEQGGMEDLQQEYLKTIPEKLTTFEGLIKRLEGGLSKTELENLKMISHKTAGSAGSYGFMDVTKLCRDMEQKLKEKLEGFKEGDSHPEWIDEFWEFFRRLKASFQAPEPIQKEGEKKEPPPPSKSASHIYLVDDDKGLTDLLFEMGKKKGFEIEMENDPQKAKERLLKPEFNPDILLMDKHFEGSELSGFTLLKEFRESRGHELHTRLGMLTQSGDDQDRTEAMTLGVELFFEKPVDPEMIFRTLQEVSDHQSLGEHKYHGMMIDDDKDFCNLVKKALQGLNVVLNDYQSGDHFIELVEKENPDFILLDIEVPPTSGLQFLEMLRTDFRYRDLPVIMISSHSEGGNLEKAYEMCVEDFIQKPVEEKMLQIRMKNFLRKYAKLLTMGNIDPETGLYHQGVLKDLFQLFAKQNAHITVALLQVTEKEGGTFFDQAMKKGGEKLRNSFREQDLIGVWEKGQFMMVFPKQKGPQTKNLVERLFQSLREEEPFKEHEEVAMSCGIVSFPDHGKDLGALARQAQQQLDFAISEGKWTIHSAEEASHERGEGLKGKKALLVDDDQDITQIIKNTFEARGMEVQVFNEGEGAVDWMKGNLFQTPPDLIILDWMLPGISGIEVLEQIRRQVGQSIPVIILSSLSQEQNVLEGLQKGASEYLTKPFSMQVLLEKTEGLIG